MKFKSLVAGVLLAVVFTGCSKDQLLLKTYSPPKKQQEVKNLISKSDITKEGYISMEIVDDINYIVNSKNNVSDRKRLAKSLIVDLKKNITNTNFISISTVSDVSPVSLDMKIIDYSYEQNSNTIKGFVEVEFNIRKDYEVFYTQKYHKKIFRQSRSGAQGLPSKSLIFSQISQYLAKKLVKDISPLQTRKLVELKSLPDELKYTIGYAKGSNFKSAIKVMQNYKGKKDKDFYFNLAVYYEGLAAKEDNIDLLVKADDNYEKAMQLGGSKDEVILKGKTKFDNYYDLLKKIIKQRESNNKNRDTNYELLD